MEWAKEAKELIDAKTDKKKSLMAGVILQSHVCINLCGDAKYTFLLL